MKCYLCGNSKLKIIKTKLRHNIQRNVLECQNCGLVFLEPKKVDLKSYYSKGYRELYTPVIGRTLTSSEIFNIYLPFQQKRIDEIKEILNPKMKVLEIGCSAGHFLYTLKGHVKECIGIELNEDNARFVNNKLGIKTYTEPIEKLDIPEQYFDLVVMFYVLEHIEDPIVFLKNISKYLKNDGHLVIKVDNIDDALLSLYNIEAYSDFWFREPHIFYFSSKTLSEVLKKAGFEGGVKTSQDFNFINHMNWILTGKPQKSAVDGMSEPELVSSLSVKDEIRLDFNRWMKKINNEYIELLYKHDSGENILFIGRKK